MTYLQACSAARLASIEGGIHEVRRVYLYDLACELYTVALVGSERRGYLGDGYNVVEVFVGGCCVTGINPKLTPTSRLAVVSAHVCINAGSLYRCYYTTARGEEVDLTREEFMEFIDQLP